MVTKFFFLESFFSLELWKTNFFFPFSPPHSNASSEEGHPRTPDPFRLIPMAGALLLKYFRSTSFLAAFYFSFQGPHR